MDRYIVSQPHDGNSNDLSSWQSLHERMLASCEGLWQSVRDVLCVDSPEGHVTEETDGLDIGDKDTLSYSWRALKEAR